MSGRGRAKGRGRGRGKGRGEQRYQDQGPGRKDRDAAESRYDDRRPGRPPSGQGREVTAYDRPQDKYPQQRREEVAHTRPPPSTGEAPQQRLTERPVIQSGGATRPPPSTGGAPQQRLTERPVSQSGGATRPPPSTGGAPQQRLTERPVIQSGGATRPPPSTGGAPQQRLTERPVSQSGGATRPPPSTGGAPQQRLTEKPVSQSGGATRPPPSTGGAPQQRLTERPVSQSGGATRPPPSTGGAPQQRPTERPVSQSGGATRPPPSTGGAPQQRLTERPVSQSGGATRPPPSTGGAPQQRPTERPVSQSGGATRPPPSTGRAAATPHPQPVMQPQATAGPLALPDSKRPPLRPGYGREGRPITLRANLFPVKLPEGTLYHYDIEITPNCPKKINRIMFEALLKEYATPDCFGNQKPVFDGKKNMYCHSELPIPEGTTRELQVTLSPEPGDREKTFKVKVKLAARVNLACLQDALNDAGERMSMIQALDVVMRHSPSLRFVPVGRSFFSPPDPRDVIDLGGGRVVWSGYHQSLRPTKGWKIVLNVDVSHTAFYKEQPVLNFLSETLRLDSLRQLRDADRVRFAKEIKGLKVEVTYLPYPRKYRVNDVTRKSASQQTFPLDGGECTVQQYFRNTYKKELQYPNLPCLHVGQKERHVYIPMELCKIVPGQRCIKKLSDYQTAQMVRTTAKPAPVRQQDIMRKVSTAAFERDPHLRDFEIRVSKDMVEVPGRVLDPPKLQYNKDKDQTVTPKSGAWDMRGNQFHSGVEVCLWAVIVFANSRFCGEDKVRYFISKLSDISSNLGMSIAREPVELQYFQRGDIQSLFNRLCTQHRGLQLIVAVLDKKGYGISYNEVKRVGNNLVGVKTQCVMAETVVKKANPPTISNLCLKINAKLGGVNNIIHPTLRSAIFKKPVIVMGADVTHPAPGDTHRPSIAALVASMDVNACIYRADARVQKHKQEIIADMQSMVREMLLEFHHVNHGAKPGRIIFYRDGVSEGQFKEVILNELSAIQRACTSLHPDYQPGITFLVVQKRHHVRFFPTNRKDEVGKSGNIPAGTTVDRDVTHPTEFDWYLCSHAGIQGTSRPCHYHVLCDDNDFSADDLQRLSYHLCHVFFRCNRSVSIPAPAYYAHLAAFHARCLLQDWEGKSDTASTSSSQSEAQWSLADMAAAIKIHDNVKMTMYFA